MNKLFCRIEKALLSVASNVSLYVFMSFMYAGILSMGPLYAYQSEVDLLYRYVLIPWGAALSLAALHMQVKQNASVPRWDLRVLLVLFAWIVVPFALRFGMTADNVSSWHGAMAVYFGIYALMSSMEAKQREKMIDGLCALFALLSVTLGMALMYCVVTAQVFPGDFGIVDGQFLSAGAYYNGTGMRSLCCALVCLWGAARSKGKPVLRTLYLIAAVIIGLTVIFTQSRTARYSLLGALAVGVYGYIAGMDGKKAIIRHAAGLLAAAVVVVGGYNVCSMLTDAALEHYARVENARRSGMTDAEQLEEALTQILVPAAYAEDAESEAAPEQPAPVVAKENRGIGDMSFTGRTTLWTNLVKIWKENPKHFVIGCGVGRVGREIIKGTVLEELRYASTHNTFLQFLADFGLIGFALLCAAIGVIVPGAWRMFFSPNSKLIPGDRLPVMIVAASVMTGMMESEPLSTLSAMNVLLFFALAVLSSRGREQL